MPIKDRSRPNLAMARIVDHGIALAAISGNAVAAAYLMERNVPEAVIARVLCDPSRRRPLGNKQSAPPARPDTGAHAAKPASEQSPLQHLARQV